MPTKDQFARFSKQGECVALYYMESVSNELTEIVIIVYRILKGIYHAKSVSYNLPIVTEKMLLKSVG